jgi:transcriptional regulator with XRE-family HTH domain
MRNMDNLIGDRLRKVREKLEKSQVAFAKEIGVSSVTISTTESGKTPLTKANTKLICLTFNINEEWLLTGKGEMFKSGHVPGEDELIEAFRQLSPEGRRMTLDYLHVILKNEIEMRGIEVPPEKGERTAG